MRQVYFFFSFLALLAISPSLFSQTLTWTNFDTGSNMSVLINLDEYPTVLGNNLSTGDYIGVFYEDDNGDLQCGGFTTWNGDTSQAISFAAYGDDTNTADKDGFDDGDAFVWKVRTLSDNTDHDATATYITTAPFTNVFDEDGFAQIDTLDIEATVIMGCTDPLYLEYNANANTDDGSCQTLIVEGCTNPLYLEYDANANTDDGSCQTLIVYGCTNDNYVEYNPAANVDNGSCQTLKVFGCTDPLYMEYDPAANTDDGSCETLIVYGCMDDDYVEYNPAANVDDGSCQTLKVYGCTDPLYMEYDPAANTDDGSCQTLIIEGCMDDEAQNYNPDANVDDGSCDYDCEDGFVPIIVEFSTYDVVTGFEWILSEDFILVDSEASNDVEGNTQYVHHYCVEEGATISFEGSDMTNVVITNCGEDVTVNTNLTAEFIAGCNIGLEELENGSIQIAPNPGLNLVQISWSSEGNKLTLIDAVGRAVLKKDISGITETELDLSKIKSGIYTLQIHGENFTISEKLIKQ